MALALADQHKLEVRHMRPDVEYKSIIEGKPYVKMAKKKAANFDFAGGVDAAVAAAEAAADDEEKEEVGEAEDDEGDDEEKRGGGQGGERGGEGAQ